MESRLRVAERLAFLDERRQGVGGSDAAGIYGNSKYKTPYTVWCEKLGLLPEKEDTEAMRQGRDFEEYVADRFVEETGFTVRRLRRMVTNPRYPYSLAHIDRRVVGQAAGLECKTCSPFRQGEFGEFEYPPEYYTQCLHYLAVTGWDMWYLAVLIYGTKFRVYEIRRDDVRKDIEELQSKIAAFWENYVLPGVPPPVDGSEATSDALAGVFNTAVDNSIDLSHLENCCIEIEAMKSDIDALQTEQERLRQEIKLAMGNNARAECGAWIANWKPRKDGVRVFTLKLK